MGRAGDPFLYALLFKFTFRNLPEALMPNIQIDVGQMKMRAQSIFSPPPLLKEQNYGQLISFTNNNDIYWSEIKFKLLFKKKPNIGR